MSVSIAELARVREVVSHILDELRLGAYLFEVQPLDGQWEVTVKCAVVEGWGRVRLEADKELLLRCENDAVAHQVLLDPWGEALSACRVRTPSVSAH